MRRLIALTLLIFTTASSLEAVVGLLRDGEVHHESTATAEAHAQRSAGDHGHEDAVPSGEHRHRKGHDHGTAGDHCTHTHGVALLSTAVPALVFSVGVTEFTESAYPHETVSEGFAHPPRA